MDIPKITGRHLGKKIERIRELRGMKQETLATGLGISQQAVSKIEMSKHIDEERLAKIAEVLGVTPEAIENFNEENVIYNIQNNYDNATENVYHSNPLDAYIRLVEENKKLYESLLVSEREKYKLLEELHKKGGKKQP